MGLLSERSRRRSVGFVVFAFICFAACIASAQTAVLNPKTLVFAPSADHQALLADGRPAVSHYQFEVYAVGAAQPFQSNNIGKPTPASDGQIYWDFANSVASWPLPGGNYEARVVAVGPMGSGKSQPSNAFTFSSCTYTLSGTSASLPAAGGGTQVSVTTTSGCTWTATSNVSWVTSSPASGQGNGTVVATIAANTATTARTATLTVGGKAFTINQAGTAAAAAPGSPTSPSPATAATGVSATPTLSWACSGATNYSVSFGTTNPPPQAASGLASTSYVPGALAAGATYYWRVTAVNAGSTTAGPVWSFTTAAAGTTPPPALPAPWTSRDLGSVGVTGSASATNGTFTVVGSGADIWGTVDAFRYVSQPVSGDFTIVARMTSEQNTNQYAKAGLMLRGALTSNSAHVILDVLPGGTVEFMTRSATGGSTTHLGGATQAAPAWLKLSRSGNTVTGSVSADGTTWRTVGTTTVSIAASANAGLAVTSHNNSVTNTAKFDNVSLTTSAPTTGLPAGWTNQDVGSVGLAGSTTYASGKFTVTGAGADIWGSADAFQFAYRALAADGEIVARLTALQNTNTYAKAGVMLRGGLTAGSPHVILDLRPNGSVEFMARSTNGGSTSYLAGTTQAAPCWLRLVRRGTTVTASVSTDGTTWRTVGSTTVSFGTAYVGLVVNSHNTSVRNTSAFDNVTVR